jgi:hypothetical protein
MAVHTTDSQVLDLLKKNWSPAAKNGLTGKIEIGIHGEDQLMISLMIGVGIPR